MVELREIKGYDGFKLQGIFYTMLSLYALKNLQVSPKQFLEDFDKADEQKKKEITLGMIKTMDSLDKEDLAFLCSFAKDKNGNPYTIHTIPSLELDEMNEIIVNLFMKFLGVNLFFSTIANTTK